MSWAEAKWIHDKLLQANGRAPSNMRMFITTPLSKTSIGVRFLEPTDTYVGENLVCAVGGVMVRMSDTDYPKSVTDGTLVVNNTELGKYESNAFVVNNLVEGKAYYFTAFPYSAHGVYKVSTSEENRSSAAPSDGEVVNVTIDIDDATGFNGATITCVDETDSTTQTANATRTVRTVSFVVPIGHKYHIEYGSSDGYSKPTNTASKTAVAGGVTSYTGLYSYFTATIDVTYPEGATVTCSYGGTVYTAPDTTGSYQFKVHEVGTWIVKAVDGEESDTKQVTITSDGQSVSVRLAFVLIYGICRDITASSPVWARTDAAVGMTATASVGTVAGSSDFDAVMPWAGIERETLGGKDVMVKIPKFYFQRYREGNIEYIKIADTPVNGFTLHPAFNHANVEKDSVYVGAYKTYRDPTLNYNSIKGVTPLNNYSRTTARDGARQKGAGWGITDIAVESAIEMLILVEFATNDVQTAIGRGFVEAAYGEYSNNGATDNVPNLTGTSSNGGRGDVVWRGIEGLWGHVPEYVDGLYFGLSGAIWVCNDPSKYVDVGAVTAPISNYKTLQYARPYGNGYVLQVGLDSQDNSHIMLPTDISGSASTGYCDCFTDSFGDTEKFFIPARGGGPIDRTAAGLFAWSLVGSSGVSSWYASSRLMYIPT